MVVEHNQLQGTPGQQPFAYGPNVRFDPGLPGLPILGQTPPDLAHTPELRHPLHIDADRDDHPPTLSPRRNACGSVTAVGAVRQPSHEFDPVLLGRFVDPLSVDRFEWGSPPGREGSVIAP